MRLECKSLILRPLEMSDIEKIHSMSSNYSNIAPYFTTKIRSKKYWQKRFEETGLWDDNYGMLMIVDKSEQLDIGVIWFFHSLPYAEGYEIGFNFFDPEKKKRNFIAIAMKLFSAYLFETYNINRIQCNTLANLKSENFDKFKKSVGFTYEGTMREAMYVRGKLVDLQLFSILRSECQSLDELISTL